MALQDKLRKSAEAVLGEPVDHVVAVQRFHPALIILAVPSVGLAIVLFYLSTFIWGSPYRLIAVTPTRIAVLKAQRMSYRKASSVERELARTTRLGPVARGAIRIDGKRYYVIAGTKKEVAAADSAPATQ